MSDTIVDELGRIAMSPNLAATLARAGEYARAQAHAQLTLEHLLLALAEDADAALVLTVSNIDVPRLVADVSVGLGRIEERVPPERAATASLIVAPDLRRILEAAAAAARQSRRRDINGAIVLAAIVGDGRSTAAHLLRAQGMTFEEAIRALQRAQAAGASGARPPAAGAPLASAAGAPAAPPAQPDRAPASADAILASARERVQTRAVPGLPEIRSVRGASDEATEVPRMAPPASPAPSPEAAPRPLPQERSAQGSMGQARPDPAPRPPVPEPRSPPAEPASAATKPVRAVSPPEPPRSAPSPELRAAEAPLGPHSIAQPGEGGTRAGPVPVAPHPSRPEPSPSAPQSPPRRPEAGEGWPSAPDQPRAAWTQAPEPAAPAAWAPQRPQELSVPAEALGRGGGRIPSPAPRQNFPAPGAPVREPGPHGWPGPAAAAGAAVRPAMREAARPDPARDISAEEFARELRAPTSSPAPARRRQPSAVVAGQLVENIPRRMRLAVPLLVEARVGKAELQALARGLEGGGAAYRHEVVVTKAMSVRLRAPDDGFWVETVSPETQWIDTALGTTADDFASWRWTVTPRLRGRRRLQLLVSARTIGADGVAAETALPDQTIDIKVRTNYRASAVRWGGWLAAAVLGGLIARFGEEFYAASAKMAARIMSGG